MPNIIASLSKEDARAIASFKKSAVAARNMSGTLLVKFTGYLKDGNVAPLNALLAAILEVRSFHADAFVRFVLYHTGGMTADNDGNATFAPEKSALSYSVKDCTFAIRGTSLNREEREACATKEEQKAAKAAKVEAQRKVLELAPTRMGKEGAWWTFAPEKPKSPYNFKSLVSALKRAKENADSLPEAQAKAVAELLAVAEQHGLFE